MVYYEIKDGKVIKYRVYYYQKEIEDLKNQITKNCGLKRHVNYEGTKFPVSQPGELIHNLITSCSGVNEEDQNTYQFHYDLIYPPKLSLLIDDFLSGSVEAIDEIMHYKSEEDDIDDQIEVLIKYFDHMDLDQIGEKKFAVDQIDKLLTLKKFNESQEVIDPYYEELLGFITLQEVNSIDVIALHDFCAFTGYTWRLEKGNLILSPVEDIHQKIYQKETKNITNR